MNTKFDGWSVVIHIRGRHELEFSRTKYVHNQIDASKKKMHIFWDLKILQKVIF